MRTQGLNGIRMCQVGIAVARADDDDSEVQRIAATRWQHRRGQAATAFSFSRWKYFSTACCIRLDP